eukprot:scaffold3955_cov160-Cylindrotheca_fusiformis.AAC.4
MAGTFIHNGEHPHDAPTRTLRGCAWTRKVCGGEFRTWKEGPLSTSRDHGESVYCMHTLRCV